MHNQDNYTNRNILLLLENKTTEFDDRIALGIIVLALGFFQLMPLA